MLKTLRISNMRICSFILLTAFYITISSLCNAQHILIDINGTKHSATSLYLTYDRAVFIDLKRQEELIDFKKYFKSIEFSNGLLITYSSFRSYSELKNHYNGTVNLINGDFFTAEILKITGDSISYISPAQNDTLFISPKEVIEINYINGLREYFASNDSTFKKTEAPKPRPVPVQYKTSTTFYIGASGGYIKSWTYNNDDYFDNYSIHGGTASIYSSYQYNSFSSLNMSLAFMPKGASLKHDTITANFKLSYLELPIIYQVQGGNSRFKMMAEAGFYLSYLLSANFTLSYPTATYDTRITQYLNHVDFGINLGAGMKYYTNSGCIITGLRYEFALTSVGGYEYQTIGNYSYFDTGQLNRCYTIYAGYAIDIKSLKKHSKK